jgi:hypothetical protein
MKLDRLGNVIISGQGYSPAGDHDWITWKYSPEGALLWYKRNVGLEGFGERPQEMALDRDGSVYVVGLRTRESDIVSLRWDLLLIKYSPFGDVEWKRRHRSRNDVAVGLSVDVDASGNVFVGGRSEDTWEAGGTGPDFVTIKYSSNGTAQWTRIWTGKTYAAIDEVQRVRATGDGGVIVAGRGYRRTGLTLDYVFIRYSAQGETEWITSFAGPGGNDFVELMELDDDGGIYASGYLWTGEEHDIMTIKLQQ